MDRIFGELKLDQASHQNSDGWLADNVWHPFANGTGLQQIYATVADKPLDLYKVPEAKTFSTNWCVQALSSAAGAIIPYVIAGKLTGMGMQAVGERIGVEGVAAKVLASESVAQIAGAGLYTFAQKPAEGHSRLAAASGTMAGFAFFSAGNALLNKTIPAFSNPVASSFARGGSRFAVGAAAGLGSYETSGLVSKMQGLKHESNWNERWQAMAHGGFVNVALPVVQDKVNKVVNAVTEATNKRNSTITSDAAKKGETRLPSDRRPEDQITRPAAIERDIIAATEAYEKWMAQRTKVLPGDLAKKHSEMSADPFKFMRGTYYRWAEKYPELLPELQKAPVVNSVGDLHTENFGTWKDSSGRRVWGVNDFDESFPLPYTNDLVRVVTSANMLKQNGMLKLSLKDAATEILDGYRQGLQDGGKPIVLSENLKLSGLADKQAPQPGKFWRKLDEQIGTSPTKDVPTDAAIALKSILPDSIQIQDLKLGHRQAGVGSLGRQRFAALGEVAGENVAAEVKALLPSANYFASGKPGEKSHYIETMGQAVRAADPNLNVQGNWVVRSLSPDRFKIDLAELTHGKDEAAVLRAMGYEAANIHLGSKSTVPSILRDLSARDSRNPNWLVDAAKTMSKSTLEDYDTWKTRN